MLSREINVAPNPAATWLIVTSANAQKPQKTNACARPAMGRSKITLPCSKTSHMKRPMRGATGRRLQVFSGFAARMVRTTFRKRNQKEDMDAPTRLFRRDNHGTNLAG